METNRRIAVIGSGLETRRQRACLAAVAAAFSGGAAARGMDCEVVLAVAAGSEDASEYEATGLPVRGVVWEVLDEEAAERALYYAGLIPLRSADAVAKRESLQPAAVADDGIRHLCDCDAWVFAHPTTPAAVLPLRPFLVMLDESCHHASGGLSEESVRIIADNVTAAAGVLVWSDRMRHEAVAFYGVSPRRVRLLPQPAACCGHQETQGKTVVDDAERLLEQARVWFVAEASSMSSVCSVAAASPQCPSESLADDGLVLQAYGEALAELL